jgi:hypothetical protein
MIYAQCYPNFTRFVCKIFLTEAIVSLGGGTEQIMIDNTHVVVWYGTGKDAVPVPEMAAFAERFGTKFAAHELGDANRSARVENPFHFIETNFYPGRTFRDLADLNQQLRDWCEKKNGRFLKTLQARPVELYQTDRLHLKPLPLHIPEVYAVHQRIVDLQGYVNLHTNAYSVPTSYISRRVEVRETKDRVLVFDGPRRLAEHERQPDGSRTRVTVAEHCPKGLRRPRGQKRPPIPEEALLQKAAPELASMVQLLAKKHGRCARRMRRLHRLYLEYPTDALVGAVTCALRYGLTDLERIERMVLRNIAGDFFQLPGGLSPDAQEADSTNEGNATLPPDPPKDSDDDR